MHGRQFLRIGIAVTRALLAGGAIYRAFSEGLSAERARVNQGSELFQEIGAFLSGVRGS